VFDLLAQYRNALVSLDSVPLTGFAPLKASKAESVSRSACLNARTDFLNVSAVIDPA